MELRLRLGRFRREAGLEPRNARSVGKRLTHSATGAPFHSRIPNVGETFFVLHSLGSLVSDSRICLTLFLISNYIVCLICF